MKSSVLNPAAMKALMNMPARKAAGKAAPKKKTKKAY